ncbi:kinase-like domain-containing protein, partial [Zopfochytrium polystomum]
YKYLKVLGVGVQGTVSLRLHTPTHAIVALKVISTMSSIDPDVRKSFRREVGILKLTAVHPNIVRLLDCWEGKHKVYQVFEVASGGDLEAACGGGALLPEDEAVRILTPVFDAVRFLHDLGILHRDVRPRKQSLQELQTIPVLSDFGIATFEAYSGRLATQYIEPPAHIAPEVVRGGRFTKASDNFGLGVIAVMVLLGR